MLLSTADLDTLKELVNIALGRAAGANTGLVHAPLPLGLPRPQCGGTPSRVARRQNQGGPPVRRDRRHPPHLPRSTPAPPNPLRPLRLATWPGLHGVDGRVTIVGRGLWLLQQQSVTRTPGAPR